MKMFERSSDVALLKSRIRLLEHRKKRILDAATDHNSSLNWAQSDLQRIEAELSDAKAQLAESEERNNKNGDVR